MNKAKSLRIILLCALGVIIVGYSLFQAQKILTGPVITVLTPENGATVDNTLVEITGIAKNAAHLSLDDKAIFTDKNGYFDEKLLLSPGYNVIKLTAEDKFKKSTEKLIQVILQE